MAYGISGPRCKNDHPVTINGGWAPVFCPTCGVRFREAHPFDFGILFGFGACFLVSTFELISLGYTINSDSTVAWAILLSSIPLVFITSSGLGALYLKSRFGNTLGLGRILLGTTPIFIFFLIGWSYFIFLLSIMISCSAGPC